MLKPDREWILRTPAGPEMDLAVSTVVMGVDTFTPRPYSTDIAAAWEVVEEMTRQGRFVEVGSVRGGWYCDLVLGTPGPISAPTPALAICRAALLTTLTEAE